MLKNPYVFPLVGFIILIGLFAWQKNEGGKSGQAVKIDPIAKKMLIVEFRNPIEMNSVSGWDTTGLGYKGPDFVLPDSGYAEFDVSAVGVKAESCKELFALKRISNGENFVSIVLDSTCDSLGLNNGKTTKYAYSDKGRTLFHFRARVEWNDTVLSLFVNGRKFTSLAVTQNDSVTVYPQLLHTKDSTSRTDRFVISDFKLYKM